MPALPRGVCPVCGRTVALRKGRLLRQHTSREGFSAPTCLGSGLSPKEQARGIDLDALEAVAKAAPAGPWREGGRPHTGATNVYGAVVTDANTGFDDPKDVEAYGGHLLGESMRRNVREYLIAASPDVVLELVTRIRELAEGLLAIAEVAMPDTYFANDSRCQAARAALAELDAR